jgi:hypothetical protein
VSYSRQRSRIGNHHLDLLWIGPQQAVKQGEADAMLSNRFLAPAVAVAAIALAGCGASTTGGTPTPAATSSATPTATATPIPTPTPTASQTPPSVDLSGTWTGQYSGPFNGTFSLTWTQSVAALNGTIALSSPHDTLHISGNVTGSSISFGAVGVVTYSGTVSGSSMSGSYIDIANGQSGSWSATKS